MDILNKITNRHFLLEVARGRIANTSIVTAFGYSPSTPNSTNINLWELQTTWVPLSIAQNHEIISSSSADTATGTGAQAVLIQGLDGNFNYSQEIVVPTGVVAKALVNKYLFINNETVIAAGSTKSNVGNLTTQVAGAGSTQAYIAAAVGASRMGRYTVPAGYLWHVSNFFELANKSGGPTGSSNILFKFILPNGVVIQGLPQTINNGSPSIITVPDGVTIGEKMTGMFMIDSVSAAGHDISCGCTGVQTPL